MFKRITYCTMFLSLIVSCTSASGAEQIKLNVGTPYNYVHTTDGKQNVWIRVGLTGSKMESEKKRPPVNVAIVLDRSGSMKGEKIQKAKEAAIQAVDRLDPQDIVSIVTYDTNVSVLVPSTKATDKNAIKKKIAGIKASGNTALFAGVSKGAAEVRKFLDEERVNRIILLSDGLANLGPSSPGELGALGANLMKDRISVSTLGLGLGYNEDLMMKLAAKSGGNHVFIENADELADIFNKEFDDVMSVVAQNLKIKLKIPEGIRPIRVLGNDADINGQIIETRLAQVYSEQVRYVLVELEIPAGQKDQRLPLGTTSVSYRDMKTGDIKQQAKTDLSVKFVSGETADDLIKFSLKEHILEDIVAMVANERNKLATTYLDDGKIGLCIQTLDENKLWLENNSLKLKSKKLETYYKYNDAQLDQLKNNKKNLARKAMRAVQSQIDTQQRYQQSGNDR
jgi:Ca-activated chloride channel homolog